MADNSQWEYRAISAGSFWNEPKEEDLEGLLNEPGEDGWEVASGAGRGSSHCAIEGGIINLHYT